VKKPAHLSFRALREESKAAAADTTIVVIAAMLTCRRESLRGDPSSPRDGSAHSDDKEIKPATFCHPERSESASEVEGSRSPFFSGERSNAE
jgi:hypothetical protein